MLVRTHYSCHCCHTSFRFLHRAVYLRGACALLVPLISQVRGEVVELVEVVFSLLSERRQRERLALTSADRFGCFPTSHFLPVCLVYVVIHACPD